MPLVFAFAFGSKPEENALALAPRGNPKKVLRLAKARSGSIRGCCGLAQTMYLADPKQFPKIVQGCKDIDTVLDNLDDELRDTLDRYASNPVKNQDTLRDLAAKAAEILDRYQSYVANNSVLKAIDMKEFADVTIYAPIMKALGDLRKALS